MAEFGVTLKCIGRKVEAIDCKCASGDDSQCGEIAGGTRIPFDRVFADGI